MNGLYIVLFFFLLHICLFIGLLLDRERVKKILDFLASLFTEIVYELGKTLFLAGIVGLYFIPEAKDFTKAIFSGIIFYIIGYGFKYKKENK